MENGIKSEIKNITSIFSLESVYHVPPYQRGYAWRSEDINTYWDDLASLLRTPRNQRAWFLGSLVLNHEDGRLHIVDGQQRLATTSLLLAVMRQKLEQAGGIQGAELLVRLKDLLFVGGEPESSPHLELSERDRLGYRDLLRRGRGRQVPSGLRRAWDLLSQRYDEDQLGRDPVEFAKDVLDVVRDKMTFSVVTVADPFNPFTVFESLNSKGQDLAQSDLIKNRLLQKASTSLRDELQEKWDRMVVELPEGQVTHYLRAWWIASQEFISTRQLYVEVKRNITSPSHAERYGRLWYEHAGWYTSLCTGSAPGSSAQLQAALATFAEMDFRQGRAILLSFLVHEGEHLVPEVVGHLGRIYVRVVKTAQQRGSKIESVTDRVCTAVRRSPRDGLETLKAEANRLIEEAGPLDWSSLYVDRPGFARYLLASISRSFEGATWAPPDSSQLEVEHILPRQRPEGFMAELPEEEYQRLVTHIGNLTLILKEDNLRCGNKLFAEKRGIYEEYATDKTRPLRITSEVARYPDWDKRTILDRAQELALVAENIWPRRIL
jgi:hypothetical protein